MNTVQRYSGRGNIARPTPQTAKTKANPPAAVDNRSTKPPLPPISESESSDDEIWKAFPGFEDRYELSSHGRICSVHSGLIIQTSIDENGFECISMKKPRGRKSLHLCIHWLVALVFLPESERLSIVKHKDGNKLNNRVENLKWAPMPTSVDSTDPATSNPSSHELSNQ